MKKTSSLLVACLILAIAPLSQAEDDEKTTVTEEKPAEMKVVKLSPKVKTVARDFSQTPCTQLENVKPQSQKEKLNLKRRKNQCVNSVNAFMKGR